MPRLPSIYAYQDVPLMRHAPFCRASAFNDQYLPYPPRSVPLTFPCLPSRRGPRSITSSYHSIASFTAHFLYIFSPHHHISHTISVSVHVFRTIVLSFRLNSTFLLSFSLVRTRSYLLAPIDELVSESGKVTQGCGVVADRGRVMRKAWIYCPLSMA